MRNFLTLSGKFFVVFAFALLLVVSSSAQIKLRNAMDTDLDQKADFMVFRPSNAIWYIMKSNGGFTFQQFGLANDDFMKMVAIAEKDKDKFKNVLITSYGYLAGYAANIKKDRPAAIGYLDKILELDPANKDAADSKQILQKAGNTPPKKGAGK